MYKKTKLKNGLKVITNRMPHMQSAAVGIWIKTGGRFESEQYKGIAHYLEHLLFKGSRKYSCRQIKEYIEGVGGALNGFTSEELTCYLIKIPAGHINLAVDVLSDMVLYPLLDPVEVDKERTVILEELKMYKDQPQSYMYELLDELLWPKQPLGQPIIGTVESISRINKGDLAGFQEKYYRASNIVVSAAGLVDHVKLASRIASIFPKNGIALQAEYSAAKEEQSKPQQNIFNKETEQAHLAIGFHAFKRDHALRHALGLLHVVLGANMSSRLFNEVREKRGLAYEIGTQVKRYFDTGAFIVHAGMDNNKVEDAISVILDELNKVKSKPINLDEFKRAKDFYLGQLTLALEDTLDHMLWIGESTIAMDKAISMADIIKAVNKIRRDDILECAKLIFKEEHLNLSLIGPLKSRESAIYNKLKIG